MSSSSVLTYAGLQKLLKEQDTKNSNKFVSAKNIVAMHVDTTDEENPKYYVDVDGKASTTEVSGKKGVIYFDLDTGKQYTFDGTEFAEVAGGLTAITDDEIKSLFPENYPDTYTTATTYTTTSPTGSGD